jgi:hypothetical protein
MLASEAAFEFASEAELLATSEPVFVLISGGLIEVVLGSRASVGLGKSTAGKTILERKRRNPLGTCIVLDWPGPVLLSRPCNSKIHRP